MACCHATQDSHRSAHRRSSYNNITYLVARSKRSEHRRASRYHRCGCGVSYQPCIVPIFPRVQLPARSRINHATIPNNSPAFRRPGEAAIAHVKHPNGDARSCSSPHDGLPDSKQVATTAARDVCRVCAHPSGRSERRGDDVRWVYYERDLSCFDEGNGDLGWARGCVGSVGLL